MIDSHCHLADEAFASDVEEVIARARSAGVSPMVSITDSLEEFLRCRDIAEAHEDIFCTAGVHPHNAKLWTDTSDGELRSFLSSSRKVKAVGEIGLDYHYDFSPRERQKDAFRAQLQIAKDLSLPAVVHCREAVEDLVPIILEISPKKLVIHCCSESFESMEPLLAKGYFLSFTGIATYPTGTLIRETIRRCPLEKMMIETDSPYLAPVPYRGKRNEPAFVVEVAKQIAEVKGISLEEVDLVTTQNAVAFFDLPRVG
jgi:TatD DNase family protein